MPDKRIIIFGCGYVGRELARAGSQRGWEVWIQSRNADSLAAVAGVPPERRIVGNLHEDAWHAQLAGSWDAAVNLVSSAGGGLDGYRLSYLKGNRSIRKWAEGTDVGRFLYTSATSVYPQTNGEWVGEEDVPEINHLSPSGAILREAELEILESTVFTECIVARLAGIYGPGRHLYLNSLREGATALPGNGSAVLNLIYLKDIVDALLLMLEAELPSKSDVFNVVDNSPVPKQEIVDWLAAELGVPSIPFDPHLAGPRAARRATGGGLPNRRVRNAKIRDLLGWQPRYPDFRAGYRDILATP
ncbi:MAG: NAD-dependent epimerase/dehydratase family protein [Oceanipulchritudo sp.]